MTLPYTERKRLDTSSVFYCVLDLAELDFSEAYEGGRKTETFGSYEGPYPLVFVTEPSCVMKNATEVARLLNPGDAIGQNEDGSLFYVQAEELKSGWVVSRKVAQSQHTLAVTNGLSYS